MRVLVALLFLMSPVFAFSDARSENRSADQTAIAKRDAAAHEKKPATIVARIWRGRVPSSRAGEYAKYLYNNGLLKIRAIPGNLAAEMFRRRDGDITEFIVISYWPNRDTIKAFAGADIEKVHFLPRDHEFLIDPEPLVKHYDVITSAP